MSNETKAFRATIVDINDEIRSKSNGKEFQLCRVQFTDGVLKGKTYFANRTLGVDKNPITVGQDILAYLTVVEDKPFFEISTSVVDDADEIMGLLGM